MDSDLLVDLGKVAGIGGIALGVALLVFGRMLRTSVLGGLSAANAYRLLRLVTVCVWTIGLAGIAAWVWVESPAPPPTQAEGQEIRTEGAQSPVVTDTEGDVSITIEGQPTSPSAVPFPEERPEAEPSAIETRGAQSPVVEGTGGDVKIDIGGGAQGEAQ